MSTKSPRFLASLHHLSTSTASAINVVGMVALIVLMLVMAVDAILRYVFKAPWPGVLELSEFTLVTIVFTGMAYTTIKKGHVRVNILVGRLQPGTQAVLESITTFIILILLGLTVWQTVLRAARSLAGNEATEVLLIPIALSIMIAALGFMVWLMVVLSDFFGSTAKALEITPRRTWGLLMVGTTLILLLCAALVLHWLPWRVDPVTAGIVGLALVIPTLLSGMPVGFVLILLGFLGFSVLTQFDIGVVILGQRPFVEASKYGMSVIPLFILMGELVFVSGLSRELYHSAHKWLGHLPGGLASATVGACSGLAAVCGSTAATAATMAAVALPEMKRYKYQPSLATGCVAGGGVIGTMIPPSITFIIYGLLTEQSIGRLFIAGVVPGVVMAVLFIMTITILCRLNPELGPPAPRVSIKEKLVSLKGVWPILIIFLVVIGGIYMGIFTPTEAAGIGALSVLVISIGMRRLSRHGFVGSLRSTMVITCMVFFLFIGGAIFSNFIALSELPFMVGTYIAESALSPLAAILLILLVFVVFGCVMPSIPVTILMVPIVFPTVLALGYNPIWFGVMVVLMNEMGALTPPVGINVFTVAGIARDIPISTIFRGAFFFFLALVVLAVLLIIFPQIALFLPTMMKGT